MSLLCDWQIRNLCTDPLVEGEPLLDPFIEGVQDGNIISMGLTSAGYDLRLSGYKVYIFKGSFGEIIDPKKFGVATYRDRVFDVLNNVKDHEQVLIPPGGYILGCSVEYIRMPRNMKGRCVGKSSYARCGVIVNTTPLESGWHGNLTIEIANSTPCYVALYVGEGIAQLEFETLSANPECDYQDKKGKYQGQHEEPIPARVKE